MLLIELLQGDYWRILNVFYSGAENYKPAANQKIIIDHNWVFKANDEAEIKSNLVWDDRIKEVILLPTSIKVDEYRKRKLAEYFDKIIKYNSLLESNQAKTTLYDQLKAIIASAKQATTTSGVDSALSQIDVKINTVKTDLGF